MISSTIWLPLQHNTRVPTSSPTLEERTDVFEKCQIYCSSREDTQQPSPAFSQLALASTMPRANFGWIILGSHKPCADCAHMAVEYLQELYFSVRHNQLCYSKTSVPGRCQGTLSGKCSPGRGWDAKSRPKKHAMALLNTTASKFMAFTIIFPIASNMI